MKEQSNQLSRRDFIKQTTAGLIGLSSAGILASCQKATAPAAPMPMRTLGKTGLQVSLLSFGAGSQFLKNKDGEWEPMIERAIQMGINYFDTASNYKWGSNKSSEQRLGEILPKYRQQVIISTKFEPREVTPALKEIETSLKDLKTDYVDILMLHSIEPDEDIAVVEKGVYKEMQRLKSEGVAKFIGFSCMDSAEKAKEAIEKLEFDVTILAMNPTKYGNFAEIALPAARAKNMGVLAMKIMRDLVGKDVTPKELLQYAWNLPGVATALVAHHGMGKLEENVKYATEFEPQNQTGMNPVELENRLARLAGPHALCWARPDYYDGLMA